MEWDWASSKCDSNITAETGKDRGNSLFNVGSHDYEKNGLKSKIVIGIPSFVKMDSSKKGAVVMLSGMHCPSINCSASIVGSNLV